MGKYGYSIIQWWVYFEAEPDGERKEEDDQGQNQDHQKPLPHP